MDGGNGKLESACHAGGLVAGTKRWTNEHQQQWEVSTSTAGRGCASVANTPVRSCQVVQYPCPSDFASLCSRQTLALPPSFPIDR